MSTLIIKKYPERIVMARDIDKPKFVKAQPEPTTADFIIKRIGNILVGIENRNFEESKLALDYLLREGLLRADIKGGQNFLEEFLKYKKIFINDEPLQNSYIIAFEGRCFICKDNVIESMDDVCIWGDYIDIARGAIYMGASPKQALTAVRNLTDKPDFRITSEVIINPNRKVSLFKAKGW